MRWALGCPRWFCEPEGTGNGSLVPGDCPDIIPLPYPYLYQFSSTDICRTIKGAAMSANVFLSHRMTSKA